MEQRQPVSVAELAKFAMFRDLAQDDIVEFLRSARVRSYTPARPMFLTRAIRATGCTSS
ncbi:MAG: hypothetical protein HY303_11490 [Candidatus Wallbacteria bacterium]|nr:hypothetical protein [Candidatus Wallbacteria bacterium]